jgi:hypothetical protein
MIFKLVHQISNNEFHLRRSTPYNIDDLFRKDIAISIQDKKQFCVLLDLVRALVFASKIQGIQHEIDVFGLQYADFDEDRFFEILASQMETQGDYLNFIYGKIGDITKLKVNLHHLDEEKLTELYEGKE